MTEPTDAEIIALADETRTAEGGASGYILPISFARAVLAKWGTPPVVPDTTVMQLAESVGLIGPASRTNDLHAAIQRFHDLICANATIKAAQMAAEAISEAAPQTSPASQGDALEVARLDWLLLHISGAEFRRIGVHYSGNASRADVDAARKQGGA